LDWNDLRYLLALHRGGSLAAAAKSLSVTKATISRRLSALEEAVGTPLFERKPNGLQLTAAALEAVATAEEMERASAALESRISAAADTQPRGSVRFTAPPWIAERFVIPALPELKQAYPELEVHLVGSNQLLNVAQRECDLALRNVAPSQSSLVARKVQPIGGAMYGSKLYLERKGTPKTRDLTGHDLLLYQGMNGMPGFEWMADTDTHGGKIAFRANDPEALVSAACAGLGLTAVPCMLADVKPELTRIDALGSGRSPMFLVMPEDLRGTPRVRVVADFVAELLLRHRSVIDPLG
jgi:DNA-binding transcriptional LysR family regulator